MEAIEKILNHGTWKDETKYAKLMELDTANYTNLGLDSSKKEREEVKKKSRAIYRAVSKLDFTMVEGEKPENKITSEQISRRYLSAMDSR